LVQSRFTIAMAPRGCQLVPMASGMSLEMRLSTRRGRAGCGAFSIGRIALGALLAAGLIAAAGPARAQSQPPSDESVARLTGLARAILPSARLEDGSNVPAETQAEQALPIIPRAAEIATIRRGALSGQMEHCGLDWQNRSYMPFMRRLRAGGWRGKRMAYVGLLHGLSQGMTLRARREARAGCGAQDVAAMEREAAALGDLP
jgi:hypothetical protein